MDIEQKKWTLSTGWQPSQPGAIGQHANLVLLFGSRDILPNQAMLNDIAERYPNAIITGCSTAGEICGTRVTDHSIVLTALAFKDTPLRGNMVKIDAMENSYTAGKHLAESIPHEQLKHVFVLSDGLSVNGSELVKGITEHLPCQVTATGGLSGDSEYFTKTLVIWNNQAASDSIVLIGFYGASLQVGYGSLGGWDPFGPERLITKSNSNILYEMDGKSALELYKRYLGEHANDLPAAGLLFPLSLRTPNCINGVVRTILSVDEAQQTLTFAGDVPEGSYARLMKANVNRLIDGAVGAAKTSLQNFVVNDTTLAILISCVGRRMVLKQRVEEEVEGVRDIIGKRAILTGFYSYGEISPLTPEAKCELHNQTMTITVITEK